jgi:D-tyrosyl-tRNA(Tyr) deacylase
MNLSINDINGEILSISQFTLYANPYEGNRPSFVDAMKPSDATLLYEEFNKKLEELGFKVGRGIFGADMKLDILCDGPVTINLEF